MKKVLAICLVMMMMAVMSITAFAAPNGFVSSPSANATPEIIEFKAADDDCTAKLVIIPHAEKDELPETLRKMFDKAYNEIVSAKDLTTLNAGLADLAKELDVAGSDLAVSDLFDIHVTGCDNHEGHTDFDVTFAADTLSHFVALLHMNANGEWEIVKDAKVTNNGEHLQFSVDSFSPFAIVVDAGSQTPQTGDNSPIYVYAAIMAAAAIALVVILVKSKKKETV